MSVTVTIARAIELKHAPGLIAALAYETASFYQKAGNHGVVTLPLLRSSSSLDFPEKGRKRVSPFSITTPGLA